MPGVYFFDLSSDPYETKNLWNNEDKHELRMSLLDALCERYSSMTDSVFVKYYNPNHFWLAVNATKKGNDPTNSDELGYLTHWYPVDESYNPNPTYTKSDFEESLGMVSGQCPFDSYREEVAKGSAIKEVHLSTLMWAGADT